MDLYAVLYSKFSPASQRFLAMLDQMPQMRHTRICVDNRDVRKRITTHQKLPVQEVPCVIRVFADTGYTELFEGERAFTLLRNLMKDVAPIITPSVSTSSSSSSTPSVPSLQPPVFTLPPSTPASSPSMTPLPGPKLPAQMSLQQHMDSVEMSMPIVAAPVPIPKVVAPLPDPVVQVSKTPQFEEIPSKPPSTSIGTTATPILPANSLNIGATATNAMLMNNNTYLNEIEKESMQRGVPERALKNNSNGGGSIVLRAQQMQKEREQEISSSPGSMAMRM